MHIDITLTWGLALMTVVSLLGCIFGYFARGFTDACKEMERREDAWGDCPAPQERDGYGLPSVSRFRPAPQWKEVKKKNEKR